MAKLSEIIAEMNDDVDVQYLSSSYVNVKDKKEYTEVTFATNEVNCNSFFQEKRVGIVVWVDKGECNKAVSKLNNKN